MYKFHHDYIKNKYDNKCKLLFTDTDSLMHEIKTEDVYEDFSSYKDSTKPKYYDYSNKLVIGKMKDETRGAAIGNFLRLKPKMYSFLVDNSEHKKEKGVNRNAVATTSHNDYKEALLVNSKCIRHSLNRIQSKDYKIGAYQINKISLSRFNGKYIFKTMDMTV